MSKEECVKYKEELKFAYDHIGTELDNDSLRNCISLGIVGYEKLMKQYFELIKKQEILLDKIDEMNATINSLDSELYEFNHSKPYKFGELHDGMWVWDDKHEDCKQICRLNEEKRAIWYYGIYVEYEADKFEENRFYPLEKANQRGEIK